MALKKYHIRCETCEGEALVLIPEEKDGIVFCPFCSSTLESEKPSSDQENRP